LGFSEYTKIDPDTGINQREQDFYNAWQQVVIKIFEHKPDVVVHAGDLFHTPRPTNRAIRIALESIQRISDAEIPFIIVAGNHETPRIRTTGSIFESLSLFKNVYAAYNNIYESFYIKGVTFHCVPHCSLTEELEHAFKSIKLSPKGPNILLTHGAWSGKQEYCMGEFNEQRLPDVESVNNIKFDYVALGHYHRQIDIKPHICYSGSTERTSLNEHNSTCGYIVYKLGSNKKEYHEIKTRSMIKLPPLNCLDLTSIEIYKQLESMASLITKDAIVQIVLENIVNDIFIKLDVKKINDIFNCFHLEKHLVRLSLQADTEFASSFIDSLPVEFERYLGKVEFKELKKDRLAKLGIEYLQGEKS
jgi:DNA repair protein SbcD/Mre11